MSKKGTHLFVDTKTKQMVQEIADKEERSMTKVISRIVREAHDRLVKGIGFDNAVG